MPASLTVDEVAERLGGAVEGDGERRVVDVKVLVEAGPEHLSFLAHRKYLPDFARTRAGAVLVGRDAKACGRTVIRCENARAALARAVALFHPYEPPPPRVDPHAEVADDAIVEGATIEAFAWVGPGAVVGPGTWVEPGAYVGGGARVGCDCRLMPGSVVRAQAVVGDRVWLNPGVVIGGEGFGFVRGDELPVKIPQVGGVVLEDDIEIGANSCVDRGSLADTVIRSGARLDNLVQIGHGTEVGENTLLVAYAGTGGSAKLGKNVVLAAKAGVLNHVELGDGTLVASGARVFSDQPAGSRVAGYPAIDHRQWLRAQSVFARLPELLKRIRTLERRVVELEAELDDQR